jgi:hypothetical protein
MLGFLGFIANLGDGKRHTLTVSLFSSLPNTKIEASASRPSSPQYITSIAVQTTYTYLVVVPRIKVSTPKQQY